MARFVVRERTTYDVVDTSYQETDPAAKFYDDGTIVFNTGSREDAERVANEHNEQFPEE